MPTGNRIRANNVYGITTDNPLTVGATAMNSTGLSVLPEVTSAHSVIVLDPKRIFGDPEIVVVTAHALLSFSATIVRGQYGTVARSHAMNTPWAHVAIDEDYIEIATSLTRPTDPYTGQIIFETDTVSYRFWNGSTWVAFGTGGGGGGAATLAYTEITTPVIAFSNFQDIGLTANVTVPAGRRLMITAYAILENGNAALNSAGLEVLQDGVRIGFSRCVINPTGAAAGDQASTCSISIETPSAGNHIYTATPFRGLTPTDIFADVTAPAFIHVQDVTNSETPFSNPNVPVGTLAFSQATAANQTFTTAVTVTGCSVNVVVPAGRTVRVSGQIQYSPATAANELSLRIKEDGVIVKLAQETGDTVGRTYDVPISHVFSPTAAAHTYLLEVERTIGAGSDTVINTASRAAYILVEDITPTPASGTGAPGSTLGYAEKVSNQVIATPAETIITGLSSTVTVPDGRRLRITAQVGIDSNVSNDLVTLRIKQDGVTVNQQTRELPLFGTQFREPFMEVITPAAGMHTYTVTTARVAGTGTSFLAYGDSHLLVEDITGALWPTGEQVTAGLIASEAWTPYTPTWTNVTLGTGFTSNGQFIKLGRTVFWKAFLKLGTGGAVTGSIVVSFPEIAAASEDPGFGGTMGSQVLLSDATGSFFNGALIAASVTTATVRAIGSSGAHSTLDVTSATVPFVWTINDEIAISGQYEAAS